MILVTQQIEINTPKGHTIAVTEFHSKKNIDKTILISSATGVLQKYYFKFASYFANLGYIVYTFDYWGIGNSGSNQNQIKLNNTTLKEWGSNDQTAVTLYAKQKNPNNELIVVTHSIGGQIVGFNHNYTMIDKLVLVASQSGYWNLFDGIDKLKMFLFWHLVLPLPTKLLGYFPAKKLRLFENLPKNMALEWSKWGKKRNYLMHYHNDKDYFFDKINIPILSYSFPKDSYAPKKTVDWLANQYGSNKIKRVHYTPAKENINKLKHFGFFRESFKDELWKTTDEWIRNN